MTSSLNRRASCAGLRPIISGILSSLGLAVAVVFTGCASPTGKPSVVATRYSLTDTAKIVLMDKTVQQAVECTGLQVINRKDGRLEVIASFKNLSRDTFPVLVNAVFKGPAGELIGDKSDSYRLTLESNNTVVARFVSRDVRAADFVVRVRVAK